MKKVFQTEVPNNKINRELLENISKLTQILAVSSGQFLDLYGLVKSVQIFPHSDMFRNMHKKRKQ